MSTEPESTLGRTGGAAESAPLANVLVTLAADRTPQARSVLFRSLGEILLASGAPLSERERAEAGLILESLLREVEASLRADLARRLAPRNDVPRTLILALARDEIAVAEPVLAGSPLLNDDELIALIRTRSREHRLVIAARPGIAERIGDALVEAGEELVLERLIRNADAQLSRKAIEYLVAESERIDRFREPLLRRADLPSDLARRMYRWVSEALRQAIVARYQIDPQTLDQALADVAVAAPATTPLPAADNPAKPRVAVDDGSEEALALAHQIALRAATKGILNERYVLQNLRAGHVGLAAAALGELASVTPVQARRYLLEPGGEALALCCRAANLSIAAAISMIAMAAKAHDRATLPPLGKDEVTQVYERMTPPQARVALRLWRPAGAKPSVRAG